MQATGPKHLSLFVHGKSIKSNRCARQKKSGAYAPLRVAPRDNLNSCRPLEAAWFYIINVAKTTLMLAGAPGIEPGNAGIKIRCLTAWRRPKKGINLLSIQKALVNNFYSKFI